MYSKITGDLNLLAVGNHRLEITDIAGLHIHIMATTPTFPFFLNCSEEFKTGKLFALIFKEI
jgi:hypothetical protein